MSVITTGNFPKALMPGVHKWWGTQYRRHKPMWNRVFEGSTSGRMYEEEVEEVGLGLLSVKPQGAGLTYDTTSQGPTSRYTQTTYASGFMVTLEEIKFNLYPELSIRRAGKLAKSAYETEEILGAQIFNRGFNTSFVGGDGQPLFSASHPTASGTQSNIITGADLSEASIEAMLVAISDAVDSRGIRIANKARLLVVSNTDQFEATRITRSVLQNDTANNAINAIREMNTFPDGVLTWPYLTDPDAWFIVTDCMDGLKRFTAMAPDIEQDNDFDTKNFRASVIAMLVYGWTNWRQVYGSEGG